MNIQKKYILIIILGLVFAIITPFFVLNGDKENNYEEKLEDTTKINKMEKFLIHLDDDLRVDIEENVDVEKLYNDIVEIENHTYYAELGELFNKANKEFKKIDTSFVKYYNDEHTLRETLTCAVYDDLVKFEAANLLGEDKNEEYPKEDIDKLYYKGLIDLAEFKHEEFISDMDKVLKTYKFTSEENKKMGDLYSDMNLLYETMDTSTVDYLGSLSDPNAFLVEVMRLFVDERYDFIEDKESPFISDSTIIMINNSEKIIVDDKTTDPILKEINKKYKTIRGTITVYKTEFKDALNLDTFTAYIITDETNEFKVYTITSDKEYFKTIGDYYLEDKKEDSYSPVRP